MQARAGPDHLPRDDIESYGDGVVRNTGHRPWCAWCAMISVTGPGQFAGVVV
jgi:hypothetical protein